MISFCTDILISFHIPVTEWFIPYSYVSIFNKNFLGLLDLNFHVSTFTFGVIFPSCRLYSSFFFLSRFNFYPVKYNRSYSLSFFFFLISFSLPRSLWTPYSTSLDCMSITLRVFLSSFSLLPTFVELRLLFVVRYVDSSNCLRLLLFKFLLGVLPSTNSLTTVCLS